MTTSSEPASAPDALITSTSSGDPPPRRVMFYDATDTKPGVELADAWMMGGWLYRGLRRLDTCRGFSSWLDALAWLESVVEQGTVEEIQYWGHGSPGAIWLAGKPLTLANADSLSWMRGKVKKLFWFRTCASFAGPVGQAFARKLVDVLDCRVAAHTFNVGVWQSGLHSLRPGAEPSWSVTEGLGPDQRPTFGRPWSPNTVTFLHSSFPESW